MVHVIALLARAGHGKTTIARYLQSTYGARVVSLAAPLKKIAKVVMNFSDDQLYGTQAQKEEIDPRYGMSARIFLQKLGTEGIRENLGPMVWCQALENFISKDFLEKAPANDNEDPSETFGNEDAIYVVDDARFPNEIEFINGLGERTGNNIRGYAIKVTCTDAPASGNDAHPSEAGIDLVPRDQLAADIVSSRAQGIDHLIGEFERALKAMPFTLRCACRAAAEDRREEPSIGPGHNG